MDKTEQVVITTKRLGKGMAIMLFPVLFIISNSIHPDLFDISMIHDVQSWIEHFHGNRLLHFAHILELFMAPLLIVIALHFMDKLTSKGVCFGLIGGVMAILGAIFLAAGKGALCLTTSAFDTLPEQQFAMITPALEVMLHKQGNLFLLWLISLLPIGFLIQGIGLFKAGHLSRWQNILFLLGSLLLVNPEIELINLIAAIILFFALFPYAISIIKGGVK
ncbi:MAG: hypothetical protein SV375_06485 [Thermodesulfobacteriota bacterium]|nr:hypothetical protein [Thermodesulfobacteriota bacterium]